MCSKENNLFLIFFCQFIYNIKSINDLKFIEHYCSNSIKAKRICRYPFFLLPNCIWLENKLISKSKRDKIYLFEVNILISSSEHSFAFIFPFRFNSIRRFLRSISLSFPPGLAVWSLFGECFGLIEWDCVRWQLNFVFILRLGVFGFYSN